MKIESFGGADTVTGSCHRLELKSSSFLVDAGLFQGAETKIHKNSARLPFNIHEIKAIFLTHAHLDHCGLLPLLCLKGFEGPIFATEATRDLAFIILKDAAKIQQAAARSHNKNIIKTSKRIKPLYRTQDVERVMNLIRVVKIGETLEFAGVTCQFFSAGHIPGATSVSFRIPAIEAQSARALKVLFSGDIGRNDDIIMLPPEVEGGHDVIFVESTYGDHNHHKTLTIYDELSDLIKKVKKKGSVLLIPAFTVARTQMVISLLHQVITKNPQLDLPIIMDSPMGLQVNKVFKKHIDFLRLDLKQWDAMFERVLEVEEKWQEEKVNTMPEGHILISSSGMMTGGKVVSHFARLAFDSDNIIFLPGYQGSGTLGRQLVDGKRSFSINPEGLDDQAQEETLEVRCQVVQSKELSAHADQAQLSDWLKKAAHNDSQRTSIFLIHGEPEVKEVFKKHLQGLNFKSVTSVDFERPFEIS